MVRVAFVKKQLLTKSTLQQDEIILSIWYVILIFKSVWTKKSSCYIFWNVSSNRKSEILINAIIFKLKFVSRKVYHISNFLGPIDSFAKTRLLTILFNSMLLVCILFNLNKLPGILYFRLKDLNHFFELFFHTFFTFFKFLLLLC